jgi:hypothetical protein
MRNLLIISLFITLFTACDNARTFNDHFMLYSANIDENIDLIYTNSQHEMFVVVDRQIIAYKKCGDFIFIKRHPFKIDKTIDRNTINYYIVDINKDYSDERSKPFDVSKIRFENQLKASCGGDLTMEKP